MAADLEHCVNLGLPQSSLAQAIMASAPASQTAEDNPAPQDLSANLVVTSLTAPPTFIANTATSISWNVANQGDAAADADYWYDYVFLSQDAVYDSLDYYVAGSVHDQQLGQSLAAGSNYADSMNITLPGQADAGNYYLILVTDLGQQQTESNDDDNSFAVPITLQAPDLALTNTSAPGSAILGGTVNVSWTVTNQSALPANAQYFYDYFYLSTDAVYDPSDTLVDSAFHTEPGNQPLAAGGHYSETRDVRLATGNVDDHYLLIVANAGNSQSETTRTNNVAALPIALSAPDLKITGATAPSAASVSQVINIGWDVQNQSGVIAPGIWQDAVYLSTDATLDGTDSYLASQTFNGAPLGPGQTYHQNLVTTLPQIAAGQYYLLINVAAFDQPDTDTSNNVLALPITLAAPDLVVSAASAPSSGVLGTNINVSFTVTNQGPSATGASTWSDYVYLSTDNVLDFTDSFLGSASAQPNLPLAAGASYTRNLTLPLNFSDPFGGGSLPQQIGEQSVTYYLLFVADATAEQGETSETNNIRVLSIDVLGSDIIVQSATPPAAIKAGVPFPLSWTVKNQGEAATNAQWYDAVYLSDDNTYSNDDKFLDLRYTTTGVPLAPGATYDATQNFTLPANTTPGNKYLIIRGDAFNYQSEVNESNNDLVMPISVIVPDVNLNFTASSGPASGVVGSQVAISYTVANSGTEPAEQSWLDQYYLSTDATLSPSDTSLGSFARSTPLAAGANYVVNRNLVVPNNLAAGSYYILLATDRNNTQAETDETDNVQALPITIGGPDLTVTALTGPNSAVANTSITVNWTVQNDGNTTTSQNWSDAIYLTSNPNSDGTFLTSVNVQTSLPLTAGSHYDKSATFTLPNQTGSLYLVVRANAFNQQAETNTGNNRRVIPIQVNVAQADLSVSDLTAPGTVTAGETVAISWKVSNLGAVSATTDWFDHIYLSDDATYGPGDEFVSTESISAQTPLAANASYTINRNLTIPAQSGHAGARYLLVIANFNEAQSELTRSNNVIAVPIEVLVPDLTVTSVTAPPSGGFGEVVPISFTVKNNGTGDGLGIWYDRVYVSTDPVYDGSDTWVADFQAPRPVAVGASYTVNQNITIPATTTGQRYLVIVSDYANTQIESNETNNEASASFGVDSVDLRIDSVNVPATPLTYGQPFDVSWSVTNLGTVAATQNWTDRVYLSADTTLGVGDIFIGSRQSATDIPLASNGSYTATLSVTAPIDVGNLAGNYHIIVAVDDSQDQPELSEANNKLASSAVQVQLALLPDLVTTDLAAPADIFTLQPFTLHWTDRNQGDIPAVGPWGDRVYLSTDDVFDYFTDAYYGQFDFPGTLNPGEAVDRAQEFTLPDVPGDYWIFIVTDGQDQVVEGPAEANNLSAPLPIHVSSGDRPNLIVSDIVVPTSTVLTGQTVAVSYTITNNGTAPTQVPNWQDLVFLDQDPNIDYNIGIGGLGVYLFDNFGPLPPLVVPNASYLAPGDSYTQTVYFTLRQDLIGPWYAYVAADGYSPAATGGKIIELSGTDNLARSSAFTVALAPPVDLQALVQAPADAFSGQPLQLSWSDLNAGAGRTPLDDWTDTLYLSTDNTLDPSDTKLGDFAHHGALNPGASQLANGVVNLPIGVSGDFFILVDVDSTNAIYEHNQETNNVGADAIHITLTPPPDLETSLLNVPTSGEASHALTFDFRVANNGATPTPNSLWTDKFYLSSDPTFDPADTLLATQLHLGALAPGQFYQQQQTVVLPDGLIGPYYLIAISDASSQVFELDRANNVAVSAPIQLDSHPADLVVTEFLPPTAVAAAAAFEVAYTVKNQGTGDTADKQWVDKIYLSTDSQIGGDLLVRRIDRSLQLAANQSITYHSVVTLPPNLVGSYRIYVVVDAPVNEADDGVLPGEVTGPGGRIYEAANEGNNTSPLVPLSVVQQTADLQVSQVDVAANLLSGQATTISWTTINAGPGPTSSNYWYDDVYLTSNSVIGDAGDIYLGSFFRTSALTSLGSYTGSVTATIPADILPGQYFVAVRTDRPVQPPQHLSYDNNRVFEAPSENNNDRLSAVITIGAAETPDLELVSVAAPDLVYSGRSMPVTWQVRNNGISTGPIAWTDTVFLSLDSVFDPRSDIPIGSFEHSGGLAAGDSYSLTRSVAVPPGVAGTFYVFVGTDRLAKVFERNAEQNNLAFDAGPLQVSLAPPVDLVAGQVLVPVSGAAGQTFSATYTVHNGGTVSAIGGWRDKVYLSSDAVWDVHDVLLGAATRDVDLTAGDSYTQTVTAPLPGVLPGAYYLLVRSDILNNVAETDESNNFSASLDTSSLDAQVLTLGTPASGVLHAGEAIYYRLNLPAGQTVRVHFDSQSTTASNELYASFAAVPGRGTAQFNNPAPFSADQTLLIPQSQSGAYYLLVYGDQVAVGGAAFTITAEVVPFSVSDVSPGTLTNTGDGTLRIEGARFSESTQFQLIAPDGEVITSYRQKLENSAVAYATFGLAALTPGQYDLVVIDGDDRIELSHRIEVEDASGAILQTRIIGPSRAIYGRTDVLNLEYANVGDADTPAPLILLESPDNSPAGMTSDTQRATALQVLGVSQDGFHDILRPGSRFRQPVYFTADRFDLSFSTRTISADNTDPITESDWQLISDSARPASVSVENWATYFSKLRPRLGDLWGQYVTVLDRLTVVLGQPGERIADVRELFARLYAKGDNAHPTLSVSGTLRDSTTGAVMANSDVEVFLHRGTTPFFAGTTTTDADGHFTFTDLLPGTYSLGLPDDQFDMDHDGLEDLDRPTFLVTVDHDVTGVDIFALTRDDTELRNDEDPQLAIDAAGHTHIVWTRGGAIWHAVMNDQGAWVNAQQVTAGPAYNVKFQYVPPTAANPDGALLIVWEQGVDNESELFYAACEATAAGPYIWSDPVNITSNSIEDKAPSVVVDESGQVLVVYQSQDQSIQDDSDLYYRQLQIDPAALQYTQAQAAALAALESAIVEPQTGGGSGRFSMGAERDITPKGSGLKLGMKVEASGQFTILSKNPPALSLDVTGSGEFSLTVKDVKTSFKNDFRVQGTWEGERCNPFDIFKHFKKATVVWAPTLKFEFKNALINFLEAVPFPATRAVAGVLRFIEYAVAISGGEMDMGMKLDFTGRVRATWEKDPIPAWRPPDSGSFEGLFSVGPYMKVKYPEFEEKLTGDISVRAQFIPTREWKQTTINLEWERKDPDGFYIKRRFRVGDFNSGDVSGDSIDPADAMVDETTFGFDPLLAIGTGNVYGANSVFPNVAGDLRADRGASVAHNAGGQTFIAWSKDTDARIGDEMLTAFFDGTQWSAPLVVPGSLGFNRGAVTGYDDQGRPLLVWSMSDSSQISPTSTQAELETAMGKSDLVYSVYEQGAWSTPVVVAATGGSDGSIALGRAADGALTAAWVERLSDTLAVLHAAKWAGGIWSGVSDLTTNSKITGPTVAQVGGHTTVFWTQQVGVSQKDNERIYSSTLNGSWQSPVEFNPTAVVVQGGASLDSSQHDTRVQPLDGDNDFNNELQPPDDINSDCDCDDKKKPKKPNDNKPPDNGDGSNDYHPPVVQSHDPNEIIGPAGFGDQQLISADRALPYIVRFENVADAGAAAQEVRVTLPLDSSFDARTFRVTGLGFGNVRVDLPGDQPFVSRRLDLSAQLGILVDVTGSVDIQSGVASWTLRAIDPLTGELPRSGFIGLLPPNDANGAGEGFVSFTIKPKAAVLSGTVVSEQARIVFDVNEPIDTPTWSNVLDVVAPHSAVTALPAQAGSPVFNVSWTGADDSNGSGLAHFDIYAREDNGGYVLWLENTTLLSSPYLGTLGHSYSFFSVATDNAGNVEAFPTALDAATSTTGAVAAIGDRVWNDVNGNGIFDLTEPGVGHVTVTLFQEDGTQVATTLTDAEGRYLFDNIDVTHRYYLQFSAGGTLSFTQQNAGTSDAYDSDAAPANGRTATFDVTAGANIGWDAGLLTLGSISGSLWNDLDKNAARSDGEPVLGGWTVYLDDNSNGQLDAGEASLVTGADGGYRFDNLPSSVYSVRVVLPNGWVQTSPGPGGASGVAQVYSAGADVTSSGSNAEIFAPAIVEGPASNAPSADLIQLDALRADPRFGSVDGRGYSVAVIDSGIDLNHPFFGVDANHDGIDDRIIAQYDFAGHDADATDFTGHGSHVAGIIGSSDTAYPGVAPGVGIIALKVFDDQGRGYFSYVEAALQWVLQNADTYHIAAVNMSLGDGHNWQQAVGMYGLSDELAALAGMGVVVVSAAGNSYALSGSTPGVMYPAADPNSLAVGAVWDTDRGGPWSFGGYGTDYTTGPDRIASFSQRGADVLDVFAPGAAITSANASGGVTQRSGTSMATPYVTGAAVLAQQIALDHLGRRLTLAEFRQLLKQTGQTIFDGDDEQTSVTASQLSYSRLDVYALAKAIWALDPSGPPIVDDPGSGDPGPTTPPSGQDGVPFTYTISLAPGQNRTAVDFGAYLNTITNTAPQLELGNDDAIDEGNTFTRQGSFTDADAGDSWTATVDYGDGAGPVPLTLAADHSFTLSHLYTSRGAFTVTVVVTDVAHESATDSLALTVRNVAPTVADHQYEVNEDGELNVDAPGVLQDAHDPGQALHLSALVSGPAHGVLDLHADGSFKYTPAANYSGSDSFKFKTNDGQDDSPAGTITINVRAVADTPSITGATTLKNTQTTSGLEVQRNAVDGNEVGYFKVTGITGGKLYLPNGTTQIQDGQFVAFADASPRLRFTPTLDSTSPGSFSIQASTAADDTGLAGSVVSATIIVNATAVAHTPSVTDATTAEDTQSSSGLEVARSAADGGEVGYFKVTAITGGTLFMPDGVTQLHNGDFVLFDAASPRLKFTPAANSITAGKFTIQASTTATNAGLGGSTVTATINILPLGDTPSITNATTKEDTQSSSGLVVKRASVDGNEIGFFKVTSILGGALFLPDGVTPIHDGDFVAFSAASPRLKFTPAPNSNVAGSFAIQASATASDAGLGGTSVTATISVTPVNDAPTLDASGSPYLDPIDQGSVASAGTLITDLLSRAAGGNPIGDVDPAALRGIAITAVNDAAGTWEFSTNGGTTWQAVGTVSASKSLLLAADAQSRLRLAPGGLTGLVTDAITFRAWDQTTGAAGGKVKTSTNGNDTAFSTASETASITINAANGAGFVVGYGFGKADEGRAVAVDADGNTYVAGTIGVADGAGPPSASGTGNIWIAKYSALGTLVWQQTIGASKNDVARGIALDASGNLLVTGAFGGTVDFDASAGTSNLTSVGGLDGFVLKVSGAGVFQWARRFGSSQSTIDVGNAVALDPQGNVLVAGQFGGLADFDPAGVAPKLQSAGGVDAFVLKLDSSGQFVWARRVGGSGADRANALDVDSLGRVYVTGAFSGTADFDPGSGTVSRKAVGNTDAFVLRLDSAGNYSYAATFGGTSGEEGFGLNVDANFNVVSTGAFSGKTDFDPGSATANLTSAGGSDVYVARLDASGNYLSAFRFGGTSDDRGRALSVSGSGVITVTGEFKAQADFDPSAATNNLTSAGSTDIFLAQYSSAGALIAVNRLGGGSADAGVAVAEDDLGNLYLAGSFSGKPAINVGGGVVTLDSQGKTDVLLARVAPSPLGSWVAPASATMASASSQPSATAASHASAEVDLPMDELALDEMAFALSVNADASLRSATRSRHKESRVAARDAVFAEIGT